MENWKCIATCIMLFIIPIFFLTVVIIWVIQPVKLRNKIFDFHTLQFLSVTSFWCVNLTNYCSFSYFSKSMWFTALFEWRNVWEWFSQEWLPLFLQRKIHGKKLSRYLTYYSLYGVYIRLPFLKKKNLQLIISPIVV